MSPETVQPPPDAATELQQISKRLKELLPESLRGITPMLDEEIELLWRFEHLHRLVRHGRSCFDPLYIAFKQGERGESVDRRKAIVAFVDLPRREQRKILNGWEPEDEHPTMKEVLDKEGAEAVIRVLGINASNSHISPFIEFVPGQDDTQLNVQIREGMTQVKAMRMLKEIAFLIEHHWDDLLDPGANGTFMVQRVQTLMAQHAAAIKAAETAANKPKVNKKSPSVKRRTRMLGGKGAKLIRRAA